MAKADADTKAQKDADAQPEWWIKAEADAKARADADATCEWCEQKPGTVRPYSVFNRAAVMCEDCHNWRRKSVDQPKSTEEPQPKSVDQPNSTE